MKVDIIRVADEFDFEQNVTVNFVQFRLPSGRIVRALIGEGDMKAIIEDKVRFANAPPQQVMVAPPQPAAVVSDPGEVAPVPEYAEPGEVSVFGGDGGNGELPEFEQPGFSGPPVPAYPQPSLQRPQPPRPARVVQKDEWGNPIVPRGSGANPDELVGGDYEGMTAG